MSKKEADVLFECSWEVCNKVGGIYTVVVSKASRVKSFYHEDYYAVGPYLPKNLAGQFSEEVPLEWMKGPFEQLRSRGIYCHYGTWLIEGEPKAILLDLQSFWNDLNGIKGKLWEWYKVDSLNAPQDYDEPLLWSYASGILIELLSKALPQKKMVAQFHEWLSGAGLLYVKKNAPGIGTIFTTHATVLGRSLANSQIDLYDVMGKIDPDSKAYEQGVGSKHMIEKAAANASDAFTTVSEITGMEAEHLLKRKPDVILPNGLDLGKYPIFEEILLKHRVQRDRIREFCLSYFFPYYQFDIEKAVFYFLAGRYEFRAKGLDLYIKGLGRLNKKLKEEKSQNTVVAFIWVPAGIRNIKQEIIENKSLYNDMKDFLSEAREDIEKEILYALLDNRGMSSERILGHEFLSEMKKKKARFKKKGVPPTMTHDLYESHDIIAHTIYEEGLLNREEDRVKIIYYPTYLTGADNLLDLNYYEAMQGCHLGVFPSYYEPWGYTPLEAGALGVPAVTTDLSGFGRYFCADCHQSDYPGIFIVKRLGRSDEDALSQLTNVFHKFATCSREERTKNKLEARRVVGMVDWEILIENYIDAHNFALRKAQHK